MYHPGKVLQIFSPKDKSIRSSDSATQAMLRMWDENLITALVDHSIASDLKKGDVVLVDYHPIPGSPAPKMLITKILKGESGKTTWSEYKRFHMSRVKAKQKRITQPKPSQPYVG